MHSAQPSTISSSDQEAHINASVNIANMGQSLIYPNSRDQQHHSLPVSSSEEKAPSSDTFSFRKEQICSKLPLISDHRMEAMRPEDND